MFGSVGCEHLPADPPLNLHLADLLQLLWGYHQRLLYCRPHLRHTTGTVDQCLQKRYAFFYYQTVSDTQENIKLKSSLTIQHLSSLILPHNHCMLNDTTTHSHWEISSHTTWLCMCICSCVVERSSSLSTLF